MSSNPYAVEANISMAPSIVSDAETIRRNHIKHEASIKSIGVLYYLGGSLGILAGIIYTLFGVGLLVSPPSNIRSAEQPFVIGVMLAIGVIMLPVSIFQVWCAYGLRRLKPAARIGSSVIAGIGLLGFPLGTLISAYILYLLLSQKGEYVFSPHYKSVIAETPHVKYKTSIVVKVLAVILLVVFGLAIVGAIVSGNN